jgi:hypothetical protein
MKTAKRLSSVVCSDLAEVAIWPLTGVPVADG